MYTREEIKEYLDEHHKLVAKEDWFHANAQACDLVEIIEQLLEELDNKDKCSICGNPADYFVHGQRRCYKHKRSY